MVDRDALLAWLPPRGMTARFERFDPRPGGSYRLVLTYVDPAAARGKSSADSDVVETRYVDIVPNVRVVQAVDFVSDDPQFAGTMTMTWGVAAVDASVAVVGVQELEEVEGPVSVLLARWVLGPGEALLPTTGPWPELVWAEAPFDTTSRSDPGTEPIEVLTASFGGAD